MSHQTFQDILKDHVEWGQTQDICDQCLRPWHDGICECGHANDPKIISIKDMAMKLIAQGQVLSDI